MTTKDSLRRPTGWALLFSALIGAGAGAEEADWEWTHYGADAASTKFADISQIDSTNFDSLRIIWRWSAPDAQFTDSLAVESGRYLCTPIVIDGVLFTISPLNLVTALDAQTGELLWTYDPEVWREKGLFFHAYARGVSHWSDGDGARILFGTASAYLHSIDAFTGRPDTAFGDGGRIDLTQGLGREVDRKVYAFVSPPVIYDDVVIVGSSGMDWRLGRKGPPILPPGDVRGFDVRTGELRWSFHSPPHDGEFGADTWEPGAWRTHGGANVWSMMTIDEELGYVYLPFGTPAGDFYGGERPGDNLFGESLVCLDARTGERIWHYQLVHHGLWDYDIPAAPVMIDIVVDGRPIKAVAQVTKQAFCYVFDRVTGEPVWPIEERSVPQSTVPGERSSLTQPFAAKPAAFDLQGLTEDDLIDFTAELRAEAVELAGRYVTGPLYMPPSLTTMILVPGTQGGADWVGAAANPRTGTLFVPSKTRPRRLKLDEPNRSRAVGHYRYLGHAPRFRGPRGLPITKPPYGRITAIDLNTGEFRWVTPTGRGPKDHPAIRHLDLPEDLGWNVRNFLIATSTLLLATSERPEGGGDYWKRPERYLKAYDPATGRLIGKTPLPEYSYGGLMSYTAGGRQFVVTPVGRHDRAELVALAVPHPGEDLPPQLVERTDAEHPRFYEAVALIDSGDVDGLRALLVEAPELISTSGFTHPAYGDGYFQGAMLIHLLANNPTRRSPSRNTLPLADLLIEAGADVNAQTTEGNTLLTLAVTSGELRREDLKTPLILRVLEAGADPDIPDGRVLENVFSNYRDTVTVQTFVRVGFTRDIRFAAALGEMDTLRSYFDVDDQPVERALRLIGREFPDSLDGDQYTVDLALSYAAYWNQLDAARYLLEHGADVNSQPPGFYWRGDRGSSALHKSGDAGRLEMARLLLERGADPTQEANQWGDTPYQWSSYGDHREVQELLGSAERQWRQAHLEGEGQH